MQRIERAKAVGSMQGTHERTDGELNDVRTTATAERNAADADTDAIRGSDKHAFEEDRARLARQLDAARSELSSLCNENLVAGAVARKARKRADADCEATITDYDNELTEKEKMYQQQLSVYKDLQQQIQVSGTCGTVVFGMLCTAI